MSIESSPSEATRRAFLEQIEALLPGCGVTWTSIEYRRSRPFGSSGLTLTAPDMPGEAQICAVAQYSLSALNAPHLSNSTALSYQLLIKNKISPYFVEQCVSQDPQVIIAALKAWATFNQAPQRQELPALNTLDFAPMRRLVPIQASIAEKTRAALERGIERCSEACGRELGLVRAPDFHQVSATLTPSAQADLVDDLHHLAPDLLMSHFPREVDGRLPLRGTVLLATYDSLLPQSRDRQMWLAACAPQRRRDPQVVTLALVSLIGVNHAHRWDQARWLWDLRQEATSEKTRWGVAGLDLKMLGMENRDEHITFFTERCSRPDSSLADRVSLCLLLQDARRFEDAFALFGVEFSSDVAKVLYNQALSLYTATHTASWSATLIDVLASAAPWRFTALPAGTHQRICALPHQPQQSKLCLMFVTPGKRQQGTAAILLLENTASNKVWPHTAWQRPLELDLKRFQLL